MPPFGIGIVGEPGEVAQATGRDAFGTGFALGGEGWHVGVGMEVGAEFLELSRCFLYVP
jgi:hypothetical protein